MIHILFELETEKFVCGWSFIPTVTDLFEVIQKEYPNLDKNRTIEFATLLLTDGNAEISDCLYRLYEINDGEIL